MKGSDACGINDVPWMCSKEKLTDTIISIKAILYLKAFSYMMHYVNRISSVGSALGCKSQGCGFKPHVFHAHCILLKCLDGGEKRGIELPTLGFAAQRSPD